MEIAVISGKGGTGKSSVSAAFASLQKNMVLADCDVDAANLHILFNPVVEESTEFVGSQYAVIDYDKCTNCGVCMTYCRFDAIAFNNSKVEISETFCDGCKLCTRVCPEQAISMIENKNSRLYSGTYKYGRMVYGILAPGEENSGRLVNLVRDKAKKIATELEIENIIIDGPPGIGCPVISTVTGVDSVVIVTEPTLSGLHDLLRTIEMIQNFDVKSTVIINKSDLNNEMTKKIEKYCIKQKINVIARIPFDPEVVKAMVNCQSIVDWAPDSDFSKEIKSAFDKLVKL